MILVALTQSPVAALLTLILVAIIQQAESLVLVPVIQGRLISISPVVALLAVLAGSAIGDIAGAILAIPMVAIAMLVIDDVDPAVAAHADRRGPVGAGRRRPEGARAAPPPPAASDSSAGFAAQPPRIDDAAESTVRRGVDASRVHATTRAPPAVRSFGGARAPRSPSVLAVAACLRGPSRWQLASASAAPAGPRSSDRRPRVPHARRASDGRFSIWHCGR